MVKKRMGGVTRKCNVPLERKTEEGKNGFAMRGMSFKNRMYASTGKPCNGIHIKRQNGMYAFNGGGKEKNKKRSGGQSRLVKAKLETVRSGEKSSSSKSKWLTFKSQGGKT